MMSRQIAIPVHGRTFGKLRCSATNIAAAALWAAGLAASVVPLPRPAIEGGVVVAMALTLPDISQALRLPLLACAVLLGALTLRMGDLAPLLAGLDFAAPLAGFLVSVGVLRASLTGGARGAIARGRLDALPPAGRRSAVLLLGFALSPVFLVGVFPLLSPLVAARNDREAEKLASAALFGGALASLWSPFSVGTAFTTAAVGIAAGPEATAAMFAVALGGLAVGLVVHGRLAPSVLRQTASVVRPLLIPLGLAIVATLTATAALSLRVTQAVSLVAPFVVCLLGLGYGGRLSLTAGPAHDAIKALPECGESLRDLTVFAVGFALARALTDSGIFQAVTDAVVSLQIASCIPAILVLLAVVLAFLGVPAMVCAGLVAAASSLLMGDSPPINRLVLASYAWSSASMLSVTSGTLTIVASSFGVPLRPLVLGLNLLAIAVFGLPSMTENFGIAVAEAAASGVPLLISERVNIAPAFKRDDAAVVVAPELGPATQGLRLLLAHPDRARAMALRAERVVRQRFTWNAVADGLLSMYRQVPDAPEDAWTAASHGVVADAKAGTGPALHAALTKR